MAKDLFHEVAKQALINAGWIVTHDPYELPLFGKTLKVDLGAERLIAAQRETELIAVEVKSFLGLSIIYEFHLALGQYLHYVLAMKAKEPARVVYLALPKPVFHTFFEQDEVLISLQVHKVNLIVFDDLTQTIFKIINNA
jgi:hypothetical protein